MKKSKTRIFVDKEISNNLILYIKNKQHHFLKNVLRVKINDKVSIFDGISGEWLTTVSSINRDNSVLRVISKICEFKESTDIWLIFAPIKQYRMNIAIQKATELGVSKIIPCLTEYTNIKKININNLKENAIQSAEQCERLDIPKIENIHTLDDLLNNWPENRRLIFCDEKLKKKELIIETLIPHKNKGGKFAVLIGPEGGFSDNEKKQLNNNKSVIPVSLGKRILRSDTAITVAMYCLQDLIS